MIFTFKELFHINLYCDFIIYHIYILIKTNIIKLIPTCMKNEYKNIVIFFFRIYKNKLKN